MARPSGESGNESIQEAQASHRLEPKAMRDALDAIGELNQELLASLVLAARRDSAQPFPLADSLRDRFARLSAVEIKAISHCGVLLADADFNGVARWRDDGADLDLRGRWLTHDQAIAFGFAVLMLAWHVIHTAPGIAGVLLGMSEAVLADYRKLGLNDLVVIAQKPPGWIRPRWIDSPDIWTGIIDLAARTSGAPAALESQRRPPSSHGDSGRTEILRRFSTAILCTISFSDAVCRRSRRRSGPRRQSWSTDHYARRRYGSG